VRRKRALSIIVAFVNTIIIEDYRAQAMQKLTEGLGKGGEGREEGRAGIGKGCRRAERCGKASKKAKAKKHLRERAICH